MLLKHPEVHANQAVVGCMQMLSGSRANSSGSDKSDPVCQLGGCVYEQPSQWLLSDFSVSMIMGKGQPPWQSKLINSGLFLEGHPSAPYSKSPNNIVYTYLKKSNFFFCLK